MKLLPHQQRVMEMTEGFDNVADYIDMGGGKTFIGSEQMKRFGNDLNVIICQKSKVQDWADHMKEHYPEYQVFDLTKTKQEKQFYDVAEEFIPVVGVINYDLVFRRSYFAHISGFTLVLDESSMIQNETAQLAEKYGVSEATVYNILKGVALGVKARYARHSNLGDNLEVRRW